MINQHIFLAWTWVRRLWTVRKTKLLEQKLGPSRRNSEPKWDTIEHEGCHWVEGHTTCGTKQESTKQKGRGKQEGAPRIRWGCVKQKEHWAGTHRTERRKNPPSRKSAQEHKLFYYYAQLCQTGGLSTSVERAWRRATCGAKQNEGDIGKDRE